MTTYTQKLLYKNNILMCSCLKAEFHVLPSNKLLSLVYSSDENLQSLAEHLDRTGLVL